MYAINDALADAIIRSSLDSDPAMRARYQTTLHPTAPRTRLDLAIFDLHAPLAALRRLMSTATASLVPSAPTQPACCAVA